MTETQRRRLSIGFVLLVLVLGVVMFWFPSAWAASRGAPWWLCLTAGALTFPVLPAVWQLVAERRRRNRLAAAKTVKTAVLTGGDRFVMRCLVIAVVAIGPAVALDGKSAMRNAWDNALWIIPPTTWPGHVDGPLMSHVPSDAEVVISIHTDRDVKEHTPSQDVVLAYGDHKLMLYGTGDASMADDKLDDTELNKQLERFPFFKLDKVKVYSKTGPTFVASESWKTSLDAATGPSADVRTLLAKAPSSSTAVIAVTPKSTPELKHIKSANGWLSTSDESISVEGTVEMLDAPSALLLDSEMRVLWKTQRDKMPEKCRDGVDKIAEQVHYDMAGTTIHISAKVPVAVIGELMFCGWKLD